MSSAMVLARAPRLALRERLLALRISRTAALVCALTALAAAARFAGIGHQSYWYDEANTVWLLHFSAGGVLRHLASTETSPPLYFLAAWLWAHVFGYAPDGLRSLSALAGVITVPVAYLAGAKLLSRRAGLIVAALTACNPLLIWYSQEARSYALMVMFTSVALLAFAHLRAGPTRSWTATWAVAAGLALGTHYYSALALVPQGIWLVVHYRNNRVVRIGLEALLVWSAALVPLALRQLGLLDAGANWIKLIPLSSRAADVARTFAVGPEAIAGTGLALVSATAVGTAAWLFVARANKRERRSIGFIARIAGSGFAIAIVLIVLGYDQLDYRNALALWLPVALVIAGGLGVKRAGAAGAATVLMLCTIGVATVIGVAIDPRLQRPDWQAVARVLGTRPGRAIFIVNGCQLLPLSLSVHGLQFAPSGGTLVKEVDVISASHQESWNSVLQSGWYVTCVPSTRSLLIPAQLGALRASGRPVRIHQFSIKRLRSAQWVRVSKQAFAAAGLRGVLIVQRPESSSQPTNAFAAP